MKRSKPAQSDTYPKIFETYRRIGDYTISDMTQDKPSCFNGTVSVRKFKVTISVIDEPIEVIRERIQELWDKCDNYHHWDSLRAVAKEYGFELVGSVGSKRSR